MPGGIMRARTLMRIDRLARVLGGLCESIRTRFKRLIAQGGITTGLLHALVAMDMPGPGTVFINQSWSFPRPVYIGDTIRAEATVTSVRKERSIASLEFEVEDQAGVQVLKGNATVFQATPAD